MRSAVVTVALALVLNASAVGSAQQEQEQVYEIGEGVVAPSLETEVKPSYTAAALTAQVEGVVKLECIVRPDGSVRDARVVAPLHPGLDAEALRALAGWRFKPATKDGKSVAVSVEIEMAFSLRDGPAAVRRGPALDSPEVFKTASGVTLPVLIHERKPAYTPMAMRDGVQGRVKLACVILTDGTVGDIRVTERLHQELDEEALRSLREWTFKPGTKEGVAVPVQIDVEMTFTLRSGPRK